MPESMTGHIEMGIKPGILKNLFQIIFKIAVEGVIEWIQGNETHQTDG